MLLRRLASKRETTAAPVVRFDVNRRIAQVLEQGVWVDSWLSRMVSETKKADMETGEDQKGS